MWGAAAGCSCSSSSSLPSRCSSAALEAWPPHVSLPGCSRLLLATPALRQQAPGSRAPSRCDASRHHRRRHVCSAASKDLTASLLEAVASAALRARLRESRSVTAAISADTWSLLQGRVNGVRVTGEGWASPLNLTARRLDASVGAAVIDPLAVLLRQNIELVNVPVGTCRVLFDPSDFGHFLVHPLLVAAAARAVQGHAFAFDGSAVRISAPSPAAPGGVVECSGTWRGDGGRFIVRLLPRAGMGQGVQVHAIPTSSGGRASSASIVEDGLTRFFNSLTLDLQGVTLSFLSLDIIPGAGFAGGLADLNLRLELRKFPPLHLQF